VFDPHEAIAAGLRIAHFRAAIGLTQPPLHGPVGRRLAVDDEPEDHGAGGLWIDSGLAENPQAARSVARTSS
jgi:hypothetical protein